MSSISKSAIRIGTSGYTYSWNKRRPTAFAWYVKRGFNSVEINASYYRFPLDRDNISKDQVGVFIKVFDGIRAAQSNYPAEIDRKTISGESLRQRLVETGKFTAEEAERIIEDMQLYGRIERVSLDTYRRSED